MSEPGLAKKMSLIQVIFINLIGIASILFDIPLYLFVQL